MASSNQRSGEPAAHPVRSTGRNFASMDPERVREVDGSGVVHESARRDKAGRRPPAPRQTAKEENQGGSGAGR